MSNVGNTNELLFRVLNAYHKYFHTPSTPIPKLPSGQTVRIGLIGAATIAPMALIFPAQFNPEAEVIAVGARSKEKAVAFAKRWGIGEDKAYGSYEEVLADADVDAVYISLPNGLHAEWTIKSLLARKHILLEKPFVSNIHEALAVQATIRSLPGPSPPPVLLEAFHYRFHPAAIYFRRLLASGTYGRILRTHCTLGLPSGGVHPNNIRFNYDLGGGALMDLTYVVSTSRYFVLGPGAGKPKEIVSAKATKLPADERIDVVMEAELKFEVDDGNGGKSDVISTFKGDLAVPNFLGFIPKLWDMPTFVAETERAIITYNNYIGPSMNHSITIQNKETGKKQTEKVYTFDSRTGNASTGDGKPIAHSTYGYQLFAFVNQVKGRDIGPADPITLEDSIAQTEVIDAIYEKAGLPIRPGSWWAQNPPISG